MIAGSAKPVISLRASCMPMPKPSAKPSPPPPQLFAPYVPSFSLSSPSSFLYSPLRPAYVFTWPSRSLLSRPSSRLLARSSNSLFVRNFRPNGERKFPSASLFLSLQSVVHRVIRFSCSLYCFFHTKNVTSWLKLCLFMSNV